MSKELERLARESEHHAAELKKHSAEVQKHKIAYLRKYGMHEEKPDDIDHTRKRAEHEGHFMNSVLPHEHAELHRKFKEAEGKARISRLNYKRAMRK